MTVIIVITTNKFRTRSAKAKNRTNFNVSIVAFTFITVLSNFSTNETTIIIGVYFNINVNICVH